MTKRILSFEEEIREIEQNAHEVDITCDVLTTNGLGPCIGVAVFYDDRFSLAHYPNAYVCEFGGFFEKLAAAIPCTARAAVRPVVAGGKTGDDSQGVARDREYVLNTLRDLGFGAPHVRWCSEQEDCHELELDAVQGAILVTSQPTGQSERIPF